MKLQTALTVVLAITAIGFGCKPSEEKKTTAAGDAAVQQIGKVAEDTKVAAQDMKDYGYAQRAEFVDAMKLQVTAINADLDKLSAKVDGATDAAKAEAKPKLEALRTQVAALNKQLDDAKGATESTWNDVKAGFKKGYGDLKDGFQQARQWVSDKIAP